MGAAMTICKFTILDPRRPLSMAPIAFVFGLAMGAAKE